ARLPAAEARAQRRQRAAGERRARPRHARTHRAVLEQVLPRAAVRRLRARARFPAAVRVDRRWPAGTRRADLPPLSDGSAGPRLRRHAGRTQQQGRAAHRMNDDIFRTIEVSDPAIAADGLSFVTVKSRALRRRADVTLYVPPVAQGVADLPIVVLLHGVYGSHWAWALKGRAHLTVARLIAQGALPPVALLMPSDGLWGDGSGYVVHADHDVEHWIVDEMPALARELVAGCSARSPLLLAGLSMGGFGALRFAGKYPRRIA